MASPLRVFRRYQKQLIVFFGILLMVSFLITGSITSYFGAAGRGAGQAGEVAVTWKYGELTNSDLYRMRIAHVRAMSFLDALTRTRKKDTRPKAERILPADRRALIENITFEEALVRTAALAKKAEELGMIISDKMIEDYLGRLCDYEVPRSQFEAILAAATQERMNYRQLLEQLRVELLAQQMRRLARSGLATPSPQLPMISESLATADGRVLALMLSFFNPYSASIPPGLANEYSCRVYRKVKVELLPLKVDDYVKQVRAAPTESQLKKLFDEGKNRYPLPNSPQVGFRQRRKVAFAYMKADDEQFLQQQMAQVTEEQISKYYEDNKEFYRELDRPDSSSSDQPDQSDQPEEHRPTNDHALNDPASSPAHGGDHAADQKEPEAEKAAADPEQDEPAKDHPDASEEKPAEQKPKYKALEQVRDEIRRTLAAPYARKKMDQALRSAAAQVRKYFLQYITWQQDESQPQPKPPNFKAMAKQLNLTYHTTPLCDITEIGDYDLGADIPDFDFGGDRRVYSAVKTEGVGGAEYLYWKTAEKEAFIPALDDVRDQVVQQWRRGQAAKLAKQAAEKKAAQARKSGKPLKQIFGDRVIETNEFSWLSPGGGNVAVGGGALSISDVTGVDLPGPPFMEAVFSLHQGEVTVASNAPQNTYYVVRMTSETVARNLLDTLQPSPRLNNTLQPPPQVQSIAMGEQNRFFLDWMEELQREMDIRWNRDPQ